MIHIGDYWGRKYDFLRFYLLFRLKYNIRFTHWHKHGEIIRYPTMYDNPSFVPGSGSIVFDIGAQYGDFSLLWEKRNHAIVYAFEALHENYAEMQRDFALNKSSVHSIRTFVGNGNPIEFENTGTMATKKESINPRISTMRIDDFVNNSKVIPSFVKIDVEGFEYEVLEGMVETLEKYRPKITMETHSKALRKKCDEFLLEHGYEQWYEGRKVIGSGWMDEVVNLFYGSTKYIEGINE